MTHVKTLSILLTFFFQYLNLECVFHLAYQWMLVFYNPPFSFSFMFFGWTLGKELDSKSSAIIYLKQKMNSFQLLIHYSPRIMIMIILHHITRAWTTDLKSKRKTSIMVWYYCFTILYSYFNNWCTLLFESWSFPSLDAVVLNLSNSGWCVHLIILWPFISPQVVAFWVCVGSNCGKKKEWFLIKSLYQI